MAGQDYSLSNSQSPRVRESLVTKKRKKNRKTPSQALAEKRKARGETERTAQQDLTMDLLSIGHEGLKESKSPVTAPLRGAVSGALVGAKIGEAIGRYKKRKASETLYGSLQ